MFDLSDILQAHEKVKTGADFPQYARDLIGLGVVSYDTYVSDGHGVYFGNSKPLTSPAKYPSLTISKEAKREKFIERLKIHQNGGSDYMTFCRDSAENGVEKWTLNLKDGTCTYFDIHGEVMIQEKFL